MAIATILSRAQFGMEAPQVSVEVDIATLQRAKTSGNVGERFNVHVYWPRVPNIFFH